MNPEAFNDGEPIPMDDFDKVMEEIIEDTSASHRGKHAPLSLQDQAINEHMRMRIAGCDDEGNEAGEEAVLRDAAVIDLLHAPQVVSASRIKKDIDAFRAAMADVGGDFLQLRQEDFAFMAEGGHWPSPHIPGILPDIVRGTKERTYALLIEYVDDHESVRVPFAYNFGFTEMPNGDDRFPNLEASDIAGRNGDLAAKNSHVIFLPWRVGVLAELTSEVIKKMADLGINVPEYLHGVQGRRRGLNGAFKPVYATAAHDLGKEWIMYNTAVVHPPDTMTVGMPNVPLRSSNEGMFVDLGKRNHFDELRDENGDVVAVAEWSVFGNTPSSLLNASTSESSVLRKKGGLDIEELKNKGHMLAQVSRRRQNLMMP